MARGRVVALGDVHGDLSAMERVLQSARAVDRQGRWIGGDLVVVQTGDLLDRGDDERRILDWVAALQVEARAAGGALVVLAGNHEIMNASGDLRYVTPKGMSAFADLTPAWPERARALGVAPDDVRPEVRGRLAAFLPGGPYARQLSSWPVVARVEFAAASAEGAAGVKGAAAVFAHGGVLPQHVEYGLERLNSEVGRWLRAQAPRPSALDGEESVVWTRRLGGPPSAEVCAEARSVLDSLGARWIVVGHTVQREGLSPACDGTVWRIDVGMARHYGGQAAYLELRPDGPVTVAVEPVAPH